MTDDKIITYKHGCIDQGCISIFSYIKNYSPCPHLICIFASMQMIWAADFDESVAYDLEENCLEALVLQLPRDSGLEMRGESTDNGNGMVKGGGIQSNHGNADRLKPHHVGVKSISSRPFCGLTRNLWSKNDRFQICTVVSSTRNGHNDLPVYCVAAILIMNRQKIIRETHSFDDVIKAGA